MTITIYPESEDVFLTPGQHDLEGGCLRCNFRIPTLLHAYGVECKLGPLERLNLSSDLVP